MTNALMQWIGRLGPEEETRADPVESSIRRWTLRRSKVQAAEDSPGSGRLHEVTTDVLRRAPGESSDADPDAIGYYGKESHYVQVEWPTDRSSI
jgi:hypothetical protein